LEKQRRQWKRTYLVASLLIAAFLPLGAFLRWEAWVYGWLLAWSGSLLVGAACVDYLPRRFSQPVGYALAAFSGLCASVLTAVYGPSGPSFGLLLALPLGVMAIAPSMPRAAFLAGAGTLTGGIVAISKHHQTFEFTLVWVALSVALTGVALLGARNFQRIWLAELDAQHGRMEALQQLAKTERRLAQLERLAVTGRITGAVGHEINNPLAVLKANLDVLREARRSGAQVADEDAVLDEMGQSVDRIARTVGAMRRLVQGEAAALGPVPLSPLVDEAWGKASALLSQVRAERPSAEALAALPDALGVGTLLSQALLDLLQNAAEAALAAAAAEGRWVRLTVLRDGGSLSLVVENGGEGLSPEVERRLFEPFVTTKGLRRSGLGLAVAREQALRCGGSLEGHNRPEGGAQFTLRLQVAPQQ
jgi:signal transduction histidine kinase